MRCILLMSVVFFFKQKTAYEMRISDWSSDVCSSDLIDANGIVNVSAKDKATGKEQQIRIQASGGLSDTDIDRMVKDAETHAAEDKKRKEAVEAKNTADSLIYTTERTLAEHGDKLDAADRQAVERDLEALKEAVKGDDEIGRAHV